MAKQALGKGLGALISKRVASPAPQEDLGERVQNLTLSSIVPSPLQPRQEFAGEQLQELIESIRERGIIQPLIVRVVGEIHELIAGERRWRAASELGLSDVPVIIREASDRDVLELALIENLQREGLNPIEEATAYDRLHKDFSLTQEEISRRVGKSRASVANAMRLLDLAQDVQSLLKHGRITVGHAKVLLSLKNHGEQQLLADQIVRKSLSVRIAEQLAAQQHLKEGRSKPGQGKPAVKTEPTAAIKRVENILTHHLGTRVALHHSEKKGHIHIEYYGSDDLNRILGLIGIEDSESL
jgi:ParB family transcriptional regulator, chromosome partitioning protein